MNNDIFYLPDTQRKAEAKAEAEQRRNDYQNQQWVSWAEENNICHICGSSRDVCGGEEKHG